MNIRTYANKPRFTPEVMNLDCLTEQIGYVPVHKRVQEMQLAGYRLQGYREGLYDKTEEIDPTRKIGLDLSDLTQMARAVGRRLGEQQKLKLEQEAEALAKASEKPPADTGQPSGQGKGTEPPPVNG